ncbi:MAG TPA: LapA family protein [Gaiella sp.]
MADERQVEPSRGAGGIPRWKLILWGVIALYAILFLLVNSDKSDVNFVFFTVRTRLIWLILLSMGLGAVLASILPRWWRNRRAR